MPEYSGISIEEERKRVRELLHIKQNEHFSCFVTTGNAQSDINSFRSDGGATDPSI